MLKVARARFAELAANLLPRVEIVRADLASLPFGDEEFDIVVSQFSPLQDSMPGLFEARRVLRLDGRLAIVYWGPAYAENALLNEVRAKVGIDPYPRPDLEATEARAREAGFDTVA
jgi:ubiquinone/menaquinone biosynthesis C-methylase UbiE